MILKGICAPCRARTSIVFSFKHRHHRMHALSSQAFPFVPFTPYRPLVHGRLNFQFSSYSASASAATSFSPQGFSTVRTSVASSNIVDSSSDVDTFYASNVVSWESIGLLQDVVDALTRAQLLRPSGVQAASIPVILAGSDVVVAAETGSGKTHAYLAPIFSRLLKMKQKDMKKPGSQIERSMHKFALILCPNAMLCEQVTTMANALCDIHGTPLLKVSIVTGGQGWPILPPDIVVATPAALLNHLFAYDPKRRRRNAFVRDVKYVVYDEADMLLSGGFENQVMRLLNMFRLEEKQLSRNRSEVESNVTEPVDCKPWTEFEAKEPTTQDGMISDSNEGDNGSDADDSESEAEFSGDEQSGEKERNKRNRFVDWLRSRKVYTRSKQYIFAAATLPENGRKTPGAVLKRILPDAKWVNGLFLHRRNPRLHQKWVEVDESTQVEALLNAVNDDAGACDGDLPKKTLVFTNSVESADAIFRILKKAEIECLCYHREIPSEERMRVLKYFEDNGAVLVCTDSAARGLDIRNISHVIQAEFAKSAVDFLHRVGRTARAGQSGAVTNLYTKANRALVEAVRQAETAGLSVEGAFSRKRSFRNKLKKNDLATRVSEYHQS